ncbi:MAG TPA: hypothetical protein VL463_36195 [Kofleriaceae bacterium]|nr:hypothetical protein [Kofleriaceae bacterium]
MIVAGLLRRGLATSLVGALALACGFFGTPLLDALRGQLRMNQLAIVPRPIVSRSRLSLLFRA